SSIILTIDSRIQDITESILSQSVPIFKAKSASVIVMNPSTGEILAIATYPFFNPNDPALSPTEHQRLKPITDQFEPGSVFKTITAALLLEKGWISPESYVDCGDFRIGGKTFDGDPNESKRPFSSVLAHSINVGVIRSAQNLSPEEFYAFIRRFGFLEKTGVPFPGEARGSLPEPSRWSSTSLATLSIGQGVAVTMIQLAAAYAAVANRGLWKQPQLIKGILTPQGELVESVKLDKDKDEQFRRVISPETADKLTNMLLLAVEKGTGKAAQLKNVAVAGKTGTALMVNPQGGYFSDRYIASFIGYFPLPKPQCLILVTVEDPNGPHSEHTGGDVAAPIFREIAQQLLNLFPQWRSQYCSQPPSSPVAEKLPDLRGSDINSATEVILSLGGHPVKYGAGDKVIDQFPPPGFDLSSGGIVHIVCASEINTKDSILIPLFLQLSFRDALLKAHQWGITVQFSGTGYVKEQIPKPGEVAFRQEVCLLKGLSF
ncbi:MAG: penicillin-binding transpeptidase domain-containing protein, partial [bacterium]